MRTEQEQNRLELDMYYQELGYENAYDAALTQLNNQYPGGNNERLAERVVKAVLKRNDCMERIITMGRY